VVRAEIWLKSTIEDLNSLQMSSKNRKASKQIIEALIHRATANRSIAINLNETFQNAYKKIKETESTPKKKKRKLGDV